MACDRSWLLLAWEPPTPSYLHAIALSSADRSVARSPQPVARASTIPDSLPIPAAITLPRQRGLRPEPLCTSHQRGLYHISLVLVKALQGEDRAIASKLGVGTPTSARNGPIRYKAPCLAAKRINSRLTAARLI